MIGLPPKFCRTAERVLCARGGEPLRRRCCSRPRRGRSDGGGRRTAGVAAPGYSRSAQRGQAGAELVGRGVPAEPHPGSTDGSPGMVCPGDNARQHPCPHRTAATLHDREPRRPQRIPRTDQAASESGFGQERFRTTDHPMGCYPAYLHPQIQHRVLVKLLP